MAYSFYSCQVTGIRNETDRVRRFFIRRPDEMPFHFQAGQFIMLDLPIDSKITNRSYSIASSPTNENEVELVISENLSGAGTTYLFQEIKEGSTLQVSKPLGKFLLPEQIDTDLCFVCTGTGIAPFRSHLLTIFNQHIPHRKLYLIFGNRMEKDILYRAELEELAAQRPELSFIPVLSRDNPQWNGRKGYVHSVYEELFSDKRPAHFYLCGWHEMLKEARMRIEAMGYDKKNIRFESYD